MNKLIITILFVLISFKVNAGESNDVEVRINHVELIPGFNIVNVQVWARHEINTDEWFLAGERNYNTIEEVTDSEINSLLKKQSMDPGDNKPANPVNNVEVIDTSENKVTKEFENNSDTDTWEDIGHVTNETPNDPQQSKSSDEFNEEDDNVTITDNGTVIITNDKGIAVEFIIEETTVIETPMIVEETIVETKTSEIPSYLKKKSSEDKIVDEITDFYKDVKDFMKKGNTYIQIPVVEFDNGSSITVQYKNERGQEYSGILWKLSF